MPLAPATATALPCPRAEAGSLLAGMGLLANRRAPCALCSRLVCEAASWANPPRLGRLRLICAVLVNSNSLSANYGIKKSVYKTNFKAPALVTIKNIMKLLTTRLEDDYYSITVANHQLINGIRFVAKNYTHL